METGRAATSSNSGIVGGAGRRAGAGAGAFGWRMAATVAATSPVPCLAPAGVRAGDAGLGGARRTGGRVITTSPEASSATGR